MKYIKCRKGLFSILLLMLFVGITQSSEIYSDQLEETSSSLNYTTPPIIIESDSDFISYGFLGNGTAIDPYIIENYKVSTSANIGIKVYNTTKYFVIRDCYVSADNIGIYIETVASGTALIENNFCVNSDQRGIYVETSPSTTVLNNTCISNIGIYFYYSPTAYVINNTCIGDYAAIYVRESPSSLIINNTCESSHNGIHISTSQSSIVTHNTINVITGLTGIQGLWIYYSHFTNATFNKCTEYLYSMFVLGSDSCNILNNELSYGSDSCIYLYESNQNTINNNTCTNGLKGITLFSSSNSFFIYNLLQDNTEQGIVITSTSSTDNSIYHNTFKDNNLGGISQAYDNGTNNLWYNVSLTSGNYWSDWAGAGGYLIDGYAGSVDLFPLGVPIVPIISEFQYQTIFTTLILQISLILAIQHKRRKNKN